MKTVVVRNIKRTDAGLDMHKMREPLAKAGLVYVDELEED
jgi:hypothetical protein